MADTQRTITIKTKDGTMKKVPLAEFEKMKTAKQQNIQTSKHSNIQTGKQGDEKSETEGAEISKQETGNSPKVDVQETVSDEQRPAPQKAPPSIKQDDMLSAVLSMLDFSISNDLKGRLGALIDTRVNEIRTDEQVKGYAVRSIDDGGLGLSEEQAVSLGDAIARAARGETGPKDESSRPTSEMRTPPKKETLEEDGGAGRDLPVQEKKSAPETTPSPEGAKQKEEKTAVPAAVSAPPVVPRIPARPAPGRQGPAMQDVRSSHSAGPVSPIDELKLMRLLDFRRLGGSLSDRRERLLRKFETLRGESYSSYLDGRRAWFMSPLYHQYQAIITQAINGGQPIEGLVTGGDDLDAEEFATLIAVNRALNI